MTQATEILNSSRNADDACNRAEVLTDNIDQDWSHEATIYTLPDDSVLVVSGPQVNAYGSMDAARKALSEDA